MSSGAIGHHGVMLQYPEMILTRGLYIAINADNRILNPPLVVENEKGV